MFEGNVATFLGLSGKSDGVGEHQQSNWDFADRKRRQRNHYIKTGYKAKMGMNIDPETGEILDYVPPKNAKNPYKMGYQRRSFSKPNINLDPNKFLNIAVIGAIGYGAYIIYKRVLSPLTNSPIEDAKEIAEKQVSKTYVDTKASKSQQVTSAKTTLASRGLTVSSLHENLANTLHSYMDVASVDEAKIVKTISGMGNETFQLTAIAYGTRELATYRNSVTHLFDFAVWTDMFSSTKMLGTLKDHLKVVLSDSDQKKISGKLSLIP
jgi:hypothetical protein